MKHFQPNDLFIAALLMINKSKNNINVQVKVGEEYKPCGQIYLTEEIIECFKNIIGEER